LRSGLLTLALLAGCGGASPSSANLAFTMDPFVVPAGGEAFTCKYVPPSGVEAWVGRMHATMSAGSHHLVVFRVDTTAGAPAPGQHPCNQLDPPDGFDGLLYVAQSQESSYTLPDGLGMYLAPTTGLYFQSHYVNATAHDLTATVSFDVDTMPATQVRETAGVAFLNNDQLTIPVGQHRAWDDCTVPSDRHLLVAAGHMHSHGTAFDAFLDGAPIYHADGSDATLHAWDAPGILLSGGSTLRFQCSYENDTGAPLVYGNSGLTNEMCVFIGLYYPAPDGALNTWYRCGN
jgi:hypothetical protein